MTNHERLRFVAGEFGLAIGKPYRRRPIRAKAELMKAFLCALLCSPLLVASPGAWAQSSNDPVSQLAEYAKALPDPVQMPQAHGRLFRGATSNDETDSPLLDYVRQLDAEQPRLINADQPHGRSGEQGDAAFAALVEFAQTINPGAPGIKFAEVKKSKPVKSIAKAPAEVEATFVGTQVCMGCHAVQAAAFAQTVMGRIFRNPRTAQEKGGCETCHGAGSLHVKAGGGRGVGGIISFRKDDTGAARSRRINTICLSCHDKGGRNYWQGSTHEARDVACTNCHTVMSKVSLKGQLKKETETETCYQCHKDRRMQAQRSSHMPLREGKMTCTNCHNPHGSANDAMLKQASVNDNCYSAMPRSADRSCGNTRPCARTA